MENKEIINLICKTLDEHKAKDIRIIDVNGVSSITDYFVICSGRSTTQLASLSENVTEKLEENGVFVVRKEGKRGDNWIVIDFGDIMLHIFLEQTRKDYDLDSLWNSGNNLEVYEGTKDTNI